MNLRGSVRLPKATSAFDTRTELRAATVAGETAALLRLIDLGRFTYEEIAGWVSISPGELRDLKENYPAPLVAGVVAYREEILDRLEAKCRTKLSLP